MRSLILKAALAAVFISAPLATAYAASHGSHDSHGWRGGEHDHHHDRWGRPESGDDDFLVDPMPMFISVPRLDMILGEIRAADGRIVADSGRRLLSPAEVRGLRSEESTIRTEALQTALGDGVLPAARYQVMQRQVANLDRAISREASRA